MNPRNLIKCTGSIVEEMRAEAVKRGDKCPILKLKLQTDTAVMDHKHITKKEIKEGMLGKDGGGLLRGCIHNQANIFIGRIEKSFKRSGCHKFNVPLSEQLRAIANYLDNPPIEQKYIHPNERPKKDILTRIEYKRVCKYYFRLFPRKKVLPKWPKTGKSKNPKKPNRPIKTTKWIKLLNLVDEYRASASRKNVKRVSVSPKTKTLKRIKAN